MTLFGREGRRESGRLISFIAAGVLMAGASRLQAQVLFQENFEGVALGAAVDESAVPNATSVWSKTAPAGWTIDDADLAGVGQAGAGVTEWKGWSFANRDWWVQVAEDQRRSEFLRGTGTVAIADADEWDDIGSPSSLGTFNSFLRTPSIDVAGLRPGSLVLKFDSSFRPEGSQKASVSVSYDGGTAAQVLEWVATPDDKTNERVLVELNNPASATSMVISWGLTDAGNNWFWAIDNISVERVGPLFAEDFNNLPLQDSVFEANAGTNVWTNVPPAGWEIDNSLLFKGVFDPDPAPEDPFEWPGQHEWKGWAFATIEWWPTVDDQRRSEFIKATGVVAIADPDEWDDNGGPVAQGGQFNSFLSTPPISLKGITPNTALLKFDSAWRPECCDDGDGSNNQTATVEVSFDGGPGIAIVDWSSNAGDPNYKDDNSTNDTIIVPIPNPAGAQSMELKFGLTRAGNDWFWAVDNIVVTAGSASLASVAPGPRRVVFEISDTGASRIDIASITLTVDGVAAPATAAVTDNLITVTHAPAVAYAGGSGHPFVLSAVDQGGEPVSFSGTFSVPVPYLPADPVPGPAGGQGFFGVRYIWGTGGQVAGLGGALPAVQSSGEPDFDGTIFDTTHPFINHGDGMGYFPSDEFYPPEVESNEFWTDEDFVMVAKGTIRITDPGMYTFGVHSDDGFALKIRGAWFEKVSGAGAIDPGSPDSVLHTSDTGDSNTRAVANLAAGDYEVEFFWWERGGGDYGELYAAKGDFQTDEETDTWALIGDTGGLALVGPGTPPPPADFRITAVSRTADPAAVTLTFSADPARTYTAQYSLNLTGWTDSGGAIQPAAGATAATAAIPLNAPLLQNAPAVYFRIRANP